MSNPQVLEIGLMNILAKFHALIYLKLAVSNSQVLNDLVAAQFHGSCTIKAIESISDWIVPGALKCPRLTALSMPLFQPGREEIESEEIDIVNSRRDLGIISKIPLLQHLTLDCPVFSVLSLNHNLRRLKLTSMTSEKTEAFLGLISNALYLNDLEYLSLDLDHTAFPENGISQLTQSCPKLTSLQIKRSYLPDAFVSDLCKMMPHLESLKLHYCDVIFPNSTWAHLISHIGCFMPNLHTVSLKNCILIEADEDTPLSSLTRQHLNLRNLKIFDIYDFRPDRDAFEKLVTDFPKLTCFRTDLNSDCFLANSTKYADNVRLGMQNLEILELRFSKSFGDPQKGYNKAPFSIDLPNIRELYIWGVLDFPDFLIQPNVERLEKIELHYALTSPSSTAVYNFQKLKSLSIRGVTHLSETLCLKAVSVLTKHSPLLESIEVCSMNNQNAEFDDSVLRALIKNCKRIRSFSTFNFKFELHSLYALAQSWPLLETLSIKGNSSINSVSPNFEEEIIEPIVQNHPLLTRVYFCVKSLDAVNVPLVQVGRDEFANAYPFLIGISKYEVFRSYEIYLSNKYRIKFQIRGPIEDSLHLRIKSLRNS
jgi:hypothetical protein